MERLELLAPAKINLFLHILSRREDGYHFIFSLMEKVNLCDEIVLELIPNGIEIVSDRTDIPFEKNLAWRAAKLLQETSGVKSGIRIHLTKKIPAGGGLGGGSSDAASVLKGLNQLWELGWPLQQLAPVALRLGADCPFFLHEGVATVAGIGESITPLEKLPKLSIILINPGVHISTPWAYSRWDEKPSNELTQKNQSVRRPSSFKEVLGFLHNDFEPVVIPSHPEIGSAKEALQKVGADGVLMSGSGSTVFGLFGTETERDRALEKIEKKGIWQVFAATNWGVDKR